MSNPTEFGTNNLPDLDERAEFEAAQRKYHWPLAEADLRQDKIGNYYNHTTQANWSMWQTRAILARRAQPEGEAPQAELVFQVWSKADGGWHDRSERAYVAADPKHRRTLYTAPAAQHAESGAQAAIPRELIERVIERLSKAQIFPLASELRKALAAQSQGAPTPLSVNDLWEIQGALRAHGKVALARKVADAAALVAKVEAPEIDLSKLQRYGEDEEWERRGIYRRSWGEFVRLDDVKALLTTAP